MKNIFNRLLATSAQPAPMSPASQEPPPPVKSGAPSTALRTVFRATQHFMNSVRRDLKRKHPFAFERVGFITTRAAIGAEGLVIFADGYHAVADDDYIPDDSVGALMGSEALRKALELALLQGTGVFHVHMHGPAPRLWFSGIDLREQVKFIPDFFTVCPQMPHGAVVLDARRAAGRIWLAPDRIAVIDEFNTVGSRLVIERSTNTSRGKQT